MKMLKIFCIVAALSIAAAIVYSFIPERSAVGPIAVDAATKGASAASAANRSGGLVVHSPADNDASCEEPRFDAALHMQVTSATLHELFGDTLSHPGLKLKAIEKLVAMLKKVYGERWEEHLLDYLAAAFPDQASDLFAQFVRLRSFKEWVGDNYQRLVEMTPQEREEFLWEARRRYFGDDADLIWEAELKEKGLEQSLAALASGDGLPFDQKIDYYRESIESVYGDKACSYVAIHRQKLMDRFLKVESVQKDLARMEPEERAASLKRLRQAMGLDEEALARWEELDREREARWEKGRRYMELRKAVSERYSGRALEDALDGLRREYFGEEAETIAKEEQSGFFRFERPRVYGVN